MTVRDATEDKEADMLMWTPNGPVYLIRFLIRKLIELDEKEYEEARNDRR